MWKEWKTFPQPLVLDASMRWRRLLRTYSALERLGPLLYWTPFLLTASEFVSSFFIHSVELGVGGTATVFEFGHLVYT